MSETSNPAAGRVAVVTGGATGLGLACSKRLLALGYRVHALGKDAEEEIVDERFTFLDFDVTDRAAVADFAGICGEVDALVNAAGIIIHEGAEFTPDGFQRVMDVNVNGTQMMCAALQPALAARGGAVVNFASMWSIFGSGRNPAYASSKGAVLQLTRSLAVAWGSRGVRVNSVAPGWVRTRMSVNAMNDPERSTPIMRRIPMARWGEPDEVASAVCFLLSADASYINGIMLPIDGGYGIA
jgi:NAD(P)-dependent dehydrogenase (short-subunit alcohol dehydrogenase family)